MRWTMAIGVLLAAACAHQPSSPERVRDPGSVPYQPPPSQGPRPGPGEVHRAEPVRPPPVAHAQEPLDAAGAAAVAQSYAWERGLRSDVKKVERDGDTWRVSLKLVGESKGRLKLGVHAFSGAVTVLAESVRPHDRGKHEGHQKDDED